MWVAEGPAHQAVASSTRMPSRGSGAPSLGGRAAVRSRLRGSIRPVCSPSFGAGRSAKSPAPSIR
jgi:hypothetical protein